MPVQLVLNALRQITRRPVRTFLVLQGVIWGTALGVFAPALIHGSFKRAERDAASSGIDRLIVTLERRQQDESLTWNEIDRLRIEFREQLRALSAYAVLETTNQTRPATSFTVLATDTNALAARAMRLRSGRFFTAEEMSIAAPVGVVDEKLALQLFGTADPVGQQLSLPSGEIRVIGVATGGTDDGVDEFGYDDSHVMSRFIRGLQRNLGAIRSGPVKRLNEARNLMVPRTLFPEADPNVIEIREEPSRVLELRDRLRSRMIAAGRQPVIFSNTLLPFLYRGTFQTFAELNQAVFLLCVLVGTCVVCVLMMLAVMERSREIAIRRVEGARRGDIALQFVVETGSICAVGSFLGVPLGMGLAALRVWIEPLSAVDWAFPAQEAAVTVVVVTVIGLLGGLLPAWRATRLDPVEVLRNE